MQCIPFDMPIPVAARSNAQVWGRLVAGVAGWNPARGMDVCLLCLYVVLSCVGRGLSDGLITHPEDTYRLSNCVCDHRNLERGPMFHWEPTGQWMNGTFRLVFKRLLVWKKFFAPAGYRTQVVQSSQALYRLSWYSFGSILRNNLAILYCSSVKQPSAHNTNGPNILSV
jgi:hypothetical protein